MSPGKREAGMLEMVEFRRLPVGDGVTPGAIRLGGGACRKLPPVRIGVASSAGFRRPRKCRQPPRPQQRRLVAPGAPHAAVFACETEFCLVMVESLRLPPGIGRVT